MRLKINGTYYKYFSGLTINLKLDAIASAFAFNVRFNPENELHRKIFSPLSYSKVEIFNDVDNLIFTGIIVNHSFVSDSKPNLLGLSGYSLPGVLEDVTVPVKSYPLESINRSLKDVAERLLGLFDLKLIIDESATNAANSVYKKSVASPTDSIKAYLTKLTTQKDVILSHNEKGDVVVYKPASASPVLFLNKENSLSMKLAVNGQTLHSDISVVRQPSEDNAGVSTADTVTNELIPVFRPITKILSSGEDTDVKNAADNILASELKSIKLNIVLNRVLNIMPGSIVEVQNDECFIFKKQKFVVVDVNVKTDINSDISELSLVLPETFTSATPVNIFEV